MAPPPALVSISVTGLLMAATALWLAPAYAEDAVVSTAKAPLTVNVVTDVKRQSSRLGKLLLSQGGRTRYHEVSEYRRVLPGSACAAADRPVHDPTQKDSLAHVMIVQRATNTKLYLGSIASLRCTSGSELLAAPEWLRVSSPSVLVRSERGRIRVGMPVPSALVRTATRFGSSRLVWPYADPCGSGKPSPILMQFGSYFLQVTVRDGLVTTIDLRGGVLEVGECNNP